MTFIYLIALYFKCTLALQIEDLRIILLKSICYRASVRGSK